MRRDSPGASGAAATPLSDNAAQHTARDLDAALGEIGRMGVVDLRARWRSLFGREPPPAFGRDLLARAIAYHVQETRLGGLDPALRRQLTAAATRNGDRVRRLKPGSIIVREHAGKLHEVVVVPGGFLWNETVHASLSTIARTITGVNWNGPRFFGLRGRTTARGPASVAQQAGSDSIDLANAPNLASAVNAGSAANVNAANAMPPGRGPRSTVAGRQGRAQP